MRAVIWATILPMNSAIRQQTASIRMDQAFATILSTIPLMQKPKHRMLGAIHHLILHQFQLDMDCD